MNLCTGHRQGYKLLCNGALYRCAACGHTGCTQNREGSCSSQGFLSTGKCVKCNALGEPELLSTEAAGFSGTLMKDARAAA